MPPCISGERIKLNDCITLAMSARISGADVVQPCKIQEYKHIFVEYLPADTFPRVFQGK
jgi:hypothetical protein